LFLQDLPWVTSIIWRSWCRTAMARPTPTAPRVCWQARPPRMWLRRRSLPVWPCSARVSWAWPVRYAAALRGRKEATLYSILSTLTKPPPRRWLCRSARSASLHGIRRIRYGFDQRSLPSAWIVLHAHGVVEDHGGPRGQIEVGPVRYFRVVGIAGACEGDVGLADCVSHRLCPLLFFRRAADHARRQRNVVEGKRNVHGVRSLVTAVCRG